MRLPVLPTVSATVAAAAAALATIASLPAASALVVPLVFQLDASKYCLQAPLFQNPLPAGAATSVDAVACTSIRDDLILAIELADDDATFSGPRVLHSMGNPDYCIQNTAGAPTWAGCTSGTALQNWVEEHLDNGQFRYKNSNLCLSPDLPNNDLSLLNSTIATGVTNPSSGLPPPPTYRMTLKTCAESVAFTLVDPTTVNTTFPAVVNTLPESVPPPPLPSPAPTQTPGDTKPRSGDCFFIYSLSDAGTLAHYWSYQPEPDTYTLGAREFPFKDVYEPNGNFSLAGYFALETVPPSNHYRMRLGTLCISMTEDQSLEMAPCASISPALDAQLFEPDCFSPDTSNMNEILLCMLRTAKDNACVEQEPTAPGGTGALSVKTPAGEDCGSLFRIAPLPLKCWSNMSPLPPTNSTLPPTNSTLPPTDPTPPVNPPSTGRTLTELVSGGLNDTLTLSDVLVDATGTQRLRIIKGGQLAFESASGAVHTIGDSLGPDVEDVKLVMQEDGNLVRARTDGGFAGWSTNTWTNGAGAPFKVTVTETGFQITDSTAKVLFRWEIPRTSSTELLSGGHDTLRTGEMLVSDDKKYTLTIERNGQILFTAAQPSAPIVVANGFDGFTEGMLLKMQSDGNLVRQRMDGTFAGWSSDSWTNGVGAPFRVTVVNMGFQVNDSTGKLLYRWEAPRPTFNELISDGQDTLRTGELLVSQDRTMTLTIGDNGEILLVTSGVATPTIIATGVDGVTEGMLLKMQSDGNLVRQRMDGTFANWSSNSWNDGRTKPYHLTLETGRGAVLTDVGGAVLWTSAK
ncbi:hypothetical protein BC832DRAFT_554858 [Gaertneriomyces semiglobifer]|nr:hypothetical protein BC832DRAFT_554858 [Gaertneriomyces semiglobifer]